MNKLLLTFLLPFFVQVFAIAQNGKLFNTDNGLSSSLATQVLQNQKGRIFIATRNGLNVYDGYTFKVIDNSMPLGEGLESNYFNSICETKDGKLFAATNTGIYSFDGHRFTHYIIYDDHHRFVRTYVNHLSVLHDGTVLASTSGFGIQVISPNSKDTICTGIKGALNKYSYIYKTMEDSKGRLWVINGDFHLLCRQKNGKLITSLHGLEVASARCFCEAANGDIYVGTAGQGLFVLRNNNNSFEQIEAVGTPGNIACLTVTREGTVLAGCNGTGVIAYFPKNGNAIFNPFFNSLANIDHGKVESILQDRQGNIWVALLQKGVYMHPAMDFQFMYQGARLGSRNSIDDYGVNSVLLARNGHLWVGSDMGGLYELNARGERSIIIVSLRP